MIISDDHDDHNPNVQISYIERNCIPAINTLIYQLCKVIIYCICTSMSQLLK